MPSGGALASLTGFNPFNAPTAIAPAISPAISLQGRTPSRPLPAPQQPRVPPGRSRLPPGCMISAPPLGYLPPAPTRAHRPPPPLAVFPAPCSLSPTASSLSPRPLHRFAPFFLHYCTNVASLCVSNNSLTPRGREVGGRAPTPPAAPKFRSAEALRSFIPPASRRG